MLLKILCLSIDNRTNCSKDISIGDILKAESWQK